MRSKYNYDELVKVSGIGRLYGKVKNKLGFILEKDTYYNDYYVQLIFGEKHHGHYQNQQRRHQT